MNKDDVIREIKSMRESCSYAVAKRILQLSEQPPATIWQIGQSGAYAKAMGYRRPMTQREAERIVLSAKQRIELVDDGG
jgi:hypothetical protein